MMLSQKIIVVYNIRLMGKREIKNFLKKMRNSKKFLVFSFMEELMRNGEKYKEIILNQRKFKLLM